MASPCRWWFRESPALYAVLDDGLVCRDMTPAWRERVGAKPQPNLEMPVGQLLDLANDASLHADLSALLRGDGAIHNRVVSLTGQTDSTLGRLSAWRAEHAPGEHCVIVAVTDDTRLKEATDDLLQIRSEYQVILDAAGEGIYGLDADGCITFGNAATADILGWQVDEIRGRRSHDVHHHSHADGSVYPRHDCPIYAALKDGEVHRVDHEVFWHTDGTAVPIDYTSTPIMRDGKPSGAVVIFRDISERKSSERQREQAYAQIQELKEQLEHERDYLRDEVNVTVNFGEIIGESPALKRTLAKIEAVAATTATVLVLGESGVGKEMIARAIHSKSERADKPLVKVNCASIPKDLFESEFFGHVRGAFTGAHQDRIGRLQLASGGTLFLDEVGEIPLPLQGKLLRALQEQEFERVGDDKTVKVDVRVVAATNRNLDDEVREGRFREDLYYRLSVFPIEVPPLRDRINDIVPLAAHFLDRLCDDVGRERLTLTRQQGEMLKTQRWPGNIRELKNIIERALILTRGRRLRLDLALTGTEQSGPADVQQPVGARSYLTEAELRERDRDNLLAALRCANGQVWGPEGAAALLGIKPSTLTYRMNAFGIEKSAVKGHAGSS